MVAGVQIESHTPPCAHGGRSASVVNPSLAPEGALGKKKLVHGSEFVLSHNTIIFRLLGTCEAGSANQPAAFLF